MKDLLFLIIFLSERTNTQNPKYIKNYILLLINHLNNLSFFFFFFFLLLYNWSNSISCNFFGAANKYCHDWALKLHGQGVVCHLCNKTISLYWILSLTFSFLLRGLFIVYVLKRVYEIKIDILKFIAI